MYYKPHLLQVLRHVQERDSYGRLTSDDDRWVDVCDCRCDDNSIQEFRTDDGHIYRPKYHIVCEGRVEVNAGDEVRVIPKDPNDPDNNKFAWLFGLQSFSENSTESNEQRGLGKVFDVKRLNKLHYSEVWV